MRIHKVDWLKNAKDLTLYGTGGSFRALGSAYIKNYNYPLTLLHGLNFNKEKATILLDRITDENQDVLGVPSVRKDTISTAANIILNLIIKSEVQNLSLIHI